MLVDIKSPRELGLLIRATRKSQGVRMDDLAGVGPVFVRDAERGKPTAQVGRVLHLLDELGIVLKADIPDGALEAYLRLTQATGESGDA